MHMTRNAIHIRKKSMNGWTQLSRTPNSKEVATELHALANCAEFKASQTKTSLPRLWTTFRECTQFGRHAHR